MAGTDSALGAVADIALVVPDSAAAAPAGAHSPGGLRQYWAETLHGALPASGILEEFDFMVRELDEDADGVLSPREAAVGAFHLLAASCQRNKQLGALLGGPTPWASLRNYFNLGTPSSLMNVGVIRRAVLKVAAEQEQAGGESSADAGHPAAAAGDLPQKGTHPRTEMSTSSGVERFVNLLDRCCTRLIDQEVDFSSPKCKLTPEEAHTALYRGISSTVVAMYAKRNVAQAMGRFKWAPLAVLLFPIFIATFPFILAFVALRSRSRTGAKQAPTAGANIPGARFLFWIYIISSYYVAFGAIALFHRNTKINLPGEPEPEITAIEAWTPMVLLLFVGVTISGWQDRSLTWLYEEADSWFKTAKTELLEVEFTPEATVSLGDSATVAARSSTSQTANEKCNDSVMRQSLGEYCSELLAVTQNVLPNSSHAILFSFLVAVVHAAVPAIYRFLDTGRPFGQKTYEVLVALHFVVQGLILVTAFSFIVIETVAEYTNQRALLNMLLALTDARHVAAWKTKYAHFLAGSERYIAHRRGLDSYEAAKEKWGTVSPVFPGVLDLRNSSNLDAFLHLRRRLVAHGIDTQSQWAIFGCFITPIALAVLVLIRVVFFAAEPKLVDVHVLVDLCFFFFVLLWLVLVMVDSNITLEAIVDRFKQLQRRLARAFEAQVLLRVDAQAAKLPPLAAAESDLRVVMYMARRDRLEYALDTVRRSALVVFPVIRLTVTKTFLTSVAASGLVAVLPQLQSMLAALAEKQIPR